MIAVIDYGVANLGSMCNMLNRIGARVALAQSPDDLLRAEKIILPGIGAFDHGIEALKLRGLADALRACVIDRQVPILGVCLGAQLLGQGSEEGKLPGLGFIDAHCVHFDRERLGKLRIPHMGWSHLRQLRPSPLLEGLGPEARFYFVHSYHLVCSKAEDILATASYGYEFTAIVNRGHIFGAQFHPEKSHRYGMQLLRNFVES